MGFESSYSLMGDAGTQAKLSWSRVYSYGNNVFNEISLFNLLNHRARTIIL